MVIDGDRRVADVTRENLLHRWVRDERCRMALLGAVYNRISMRANLFRPKNARNWCGCGRPGDHPAPASAPTGLPNTRRNESSP
jgi:hypothetical protein